MSTRTAGRSLAAAATVAFALVGSAVAAGAHVTVSPDEAPAGGYQTVELTVPHGCGAEPTNELAVALGPEVQSVTAQAVPGWAVSYEMADLDEPFENHGTTITEYVASITWTATGDPLPTNQYTTFGISARWPDAAGEELLLPAVQRCTDGSESAWIDTDHAADLPAPYLTLVAASGGHGSGDTSGDTDEVATPIAADVADTSDGAPTWLVVTALVVALAALGASAFAVVTVRRT